MLNCCIRHKISHTHRLHSPHSPSVSSTITKSSPQPEFDSPTSSLSFSQRITQQLSHDDTLEGKEMTENEDDQTGNEDCKRPSQSTSSSGDEFFEANESVDSNPVTQNENGNESVKNESATDILSLESLSIKSSESPSIKPKSVELKPTLQDPLSFFSSEEDMKPLIIIKPDKLDKLDKLVSDRAGALKPYKDLILIETGKPLYVPETQVSLSVCLSVCMSVCIHVYMYVCYMYVCVYVCYMYVCMYTYMYVCMYCHKAQTERYVNQ